MSLEIDFSRIRASDGATGSRRDGFEEMAVELFRRQEAKGLPLVHVEGSGGDGGVEAFFVCEERGKVAVQAKNFVTKLDSPQWKQLDDSVQQALENHPDLREYHVYVPRERTPSQKKKWGKWVDKWQALEHGSDVKFEWHGAKEMRELLITEPYRGMAWYWFGTPSFDDAWMDDRLELAISMLGRRYQADRHVRSTVMREMDRFAWTPRLDLNMRRQRDDAVRACYVFERSDCSLEEDFITAEEKADLQAAVAKVKGADLPSFAAGNLPELVDDAEGLRKLVDKLRARSWDYDPVTTDEERKRYERRLVQDPLQRLSGVISDYTASLCDLQHLDQPALLVEGEAGDGKSHLLARTVCEARGVGRAQADRQPALLLLGEQFTSEGTPLDQISDALAWEGGFHNLLRSMNSAAELCGRPGLLVIDALNESSHRIIWQKHLDLLSHELRQYPHLRLIVACRSDFKPMTLPKTFGQGGDTPDNWAAITHRGLGDVMLELVRVYFASYEIDSPPFPPLLDEFRNPLFLDTFCQAFEGQKPPPGPVSLQMVMDQRLERLALKIADDLNCDKREVRKGVNDVAGLIAENRGRAVPQVEVHRVLQERVPGWERGKSLYSLLVSENLLQEVVMRPLEQDDQVVVRFAFERFSEFFMAQRVLGRFSRKEELRAALDNSGDLNWLTKQSERYNEGLLPIALAIAVPEKFGVELLELMPPDTEGRDELLYHFQQSTPWRSIGTFTESTRGLLTEASEALGTSNTIDHLLQLAAHEGHLLNADHLHRHLERMSLPERDQLWTLPIVDVLRDPSSVAAIIVKWSLEVPTDCVSDEQARLIGIVLLWFGSSTDVSFRERAAHAAIRLLRGRPHVVERLLKRFDDVNDPYVVERAYAVACGVALREPAGDKLRDLAATVHRLVFDTDDVRLHVLLRDYAQTLLAFAAEQASLPEGVRPESVTPPFRSAERGVSEAEEIVELKERSGWTTIASSVQPNRDGMFCFYGDFGRYTMQSEVSHFVTRRLHEPAPLEPYKERFDGLHAERWVLDRVRSLGWTPERFQQPDDARQQGGRMIDRSDKIERVGKKYQWIALHELLAYLADRYWLERWWGNGTTIYSGAWQLGVRDFDPTGPARGSDEDDWEDHPEWIDSDEAPRWLPTFDVSHPFADIELLDDREEWTKNIPADTGNMLLVKDSSRPGTDWVLLEGSWSWREPERGQVGQAEQSGGAVSWFVPEAEADSFIASLRCGYSGADPVHLSKEWLGEYPWYVSTDDARANCEANDRDTGSIAISHIRTACEWTESHGAVPSPPIIDRLDLRWSGDGATFIDESGAIAAKQVKLSDSESPVVVVRRDVLERSMKKREERLVWGLRGERQVYDYEAHRSIAFREFTAVYWLQDGTVHGGTATKSDLYLERGKKIAVPD